MKNYKGASRTTKEQIAKYNPKVNELLDGVSRAQNILDTNMDKIKKLESDASSLETKIKETSKGRAENLKINEDAKAELAKSEEKLNKIILDAFDKPAGKSSSLIQTLHDMGVSKFALGAGTAAFLGYGNFLSAATLGALGITGALAKRVNKVLTDPKIIDAYIKKEKLTKSKDNSAKDLQEQAKSKELAKYLKKGFEAAAVASTAQNKGKEK